MTDLRKNHHFLKENTLVRPSWWEHWENIWKKGEGKSRDARCRCILYILRDFRFSGTVQQGKRAVETDFASFVTGKPWAYSSDTGINLDLSLRSSKVHSGFLRAAMNFLANLEERELYVRLIFWKGFLKGFLCEMVFRIMENGRWNEAR